MLIDHITFSKSGGAGRVASLLTEKQQNSGYDSILHYLTDLSLWDDPISNVNQTARAAFDRYVVSKDISKPMFSWARRKSTIDLDHVRDNSIIHLHWIEGVVNFNQISKWISQQRKIVWTLHDMSPFTGGCHQSLTCKGYVEECSDCPQVRTLFKKSIHTSFQNNLKYLSSFTKINLVTPSNWLADAARSSRLLQNSKINVIRNPISDTFFTTTSREEVRKQLGITEHEFVAVVNSAQLDNPSKQIKECLEIFHRVSNELGVESRSILIGGGGEKMAKEFDRSIYMGIGDLNQVANWSSASDIHLVGSIAESSGMTVIECGALGVPSISINNLGAQEAIKDWETGFLVIDFDEMGQILKELMNDRTKLSKVSEKIKLQISLENKLDSVVSSYIEIYNSP